MHISLNDVLFSKIYCAELSLMHAHLMCLPLYARLVPAQLSIVHSHVPIYGNDFAKNSNLIAL